MIGLLLLMHVGPEIRTEARGLTEQHALYRADLISSVRYELGFSLDAEGDLTGVSTIHFSMRRPAPLTVDFDGGTVVELHANGQRTEPSYGGRFLSLPAEALQAGENVLRIDFRHPYSGDGVGLTRWRDPEDGRIYLFTDLEPYLANMVFPCFDQPDLKATYRITVEAPRSWVVITGAKEREIRELGARRLWIFEETARFSTYLFSLHAGEYQVWESTAGEVPLRLYARVSQAKHVDHEEWFDIARRGLAFFAEEFGVPYPFGKYDQVIAPAMNYEAMENVAAVTFSEEFVFRGAPTVDQREQRARVILHEMAHMWFGNLVTMRWWDDLWLNESFATYLAAIAVERATDFQKTWLNFQVESKRWAYWEDQLITTHPVEANVKNTEDAFANFDGITYGKGAAALSQIAFALSEETFRAGVRLYFSRHAFQNADRRDFVEALEEVSGASLSAWTAEWLQTSGLNAVQAEVRCEGDRIASLALLQTAPERNPFLRTHRTRIALFSDLANPEILDATYSGPRTELDAKGKPCPRLMLPNYGDRDYAKVLLDDASIEVVRTDLGKIADPLSRALVWHALWESVRDEKLPLAQYLEVVFAHAGAETEPVVLNAILETLHHEDAGAPVMAYLPPRDPALSKIEAYLFERMKGAPSSELKEVWFDAWLGSATGSSAGSEMTKLLQGRARVEGLELDQDRRWKLLARASAIGVPYASLLQKELARDRSDIGRRSALAVKAAHPSEAVKRDLLKRLTTMSMAEVLTVVEHLFPAGQGTLHEKILGEAYFTSLADLAKTQGSEFLSRYAGLIPATCTPKSVARLAKQQHRGDLPDLLKRPLAVAYDEDQRCVAIRKQSSASATATRP